jgi:flagellar hook-associated protein 3 FlgL
MMNRISLTQLFSRGVGGILNTQSELAKIQQQVDTGKRVLTASDDPIAAARILRLDSGQARIDQYQKNLNGAEGSLAAEDTQLEAVTNLLARVRELTVQAGDATLVQSDRQAIAAEVSTRLQELVALANSRNDAGEYIFGGNKGQTAPFVKVGGSYVYQGDESQRMTQLASTTFVAMGHTGREVFMSIPPAQVPAAALAVTTTPQLPATPNTGTGAIAIRTITDTKLYNSTFGIGGNYTVGNFQPAVAPATGVTFDITDAAGNTVLSAEPWVEGGSFGFNGAVFDMTDGTPLSDPVAGDSFRLGTPGATISAGDIVDRDAFNKTFNGTELEYRVRITGFTAPSTYSYEVLDGSGNPVIDTSATPPAPMVGSYGDGLPFRFGGADFTVTNGVVGDTFQLSRPEQQSMLDLVAHLAEGLQNLSNSTDDRTRLNTLIADTLDGLNAAESHTGLVRAQVGARLNTVDSTRDMHAETTLVQAQVMSDVRDIDYTEAVTKLTQENFVLQAAQQSFAKIAGLSLFDYIR